MKRILFTFLFLLMVAQISLAQSTTVSGTIMDTPDGQAWFNGTYSFVFRVSPSNPSAQYFWNGVPFSSFQTIAGALDGSGHYSQVVPSNTSIAPAGSTWDVTFCPQATAQCVTYNSTTITGGTQTFAPSPASIRINLSVPQQNPKAYTDTELVNGALGQTYFNLISTVIRVCSVFPCGWTNSSGGTSITLQTNGGPNPVQSLLNIKQGTGVTVTSDGSGGVTITSLSCGTTGTGVVQASNGTGGCQVTNLSEVGSVLTNNDDNVNRGPNPSGVDLREFGLRAVNPVAIPAPTVTGTGGTNTVTVSANTGLQVRDGFAFVGGGASQSMTTPVAPTVIPSCASQLTGLGYTVPAGAGSTAYQYQIAMRDVGQGLTAASSVVSISNGATTLGANSTTWTSSSSGTSNIFTATVGSTANLAAGCMVLLKGSTDDSEFGGWKTIQSVVDGTHFTYQSGVDASRGISTTTTTGGTVSYWLCNHIVLPTPGAGGIQYEIYGRTSGSNVWLASSLIANLGYTDAAYNTWDDFGSPMMDNALRPWWIPNTPPGSPTPDTYTGTITNIVGNTLTLSTNLGNSVSGTQGRFDNAPAITAALTAINNTTTTGAGGTIRFPVVVENSGTGSYCYVISTYTVITANAVIQDGSICLDDTIQLSGNWYGTELSAARLLQPQFAFRHHIPIFVNRANPGIYIKSGGINKVDLTIASNGAIGVFNTGAAPGQIFEDDTFNSTLLATNDYMSIGFYDYQNSGGQGGFGGKIRNSSFISGGTNNAYGSTATPMWVSKYNQEWDFDYISGSLRTFAFVPFSAGLSGKFHMGEEMQGPIMPVFNFLANNVGNTSGSYLISTGFIDTGSVPMVSYFPGPSASLSADFVIEAGNLPSGGQPLLSGSQFLGSILILGLTTGNQTGQNVNVTSFGKTSNNFSGLNTAGLRTPGINVAAVSYSANHTLAVNEGAVNATATLTFTLPHAVRGQIWQIFSNSGTTTLTIDSGTLHGNEATGPITIPNNTGVTAYCDGTDCYAFGLGGGAGGGSPGGSTNALEYNGGGGTFAGLNAPVTPGDFIVHYPTPTSSAVAPARDLAGVPINPQTGTTYTEGSANYQCDRGFLVTGSNVGAQTYTMGNPSTACFGQNYFNVLKNISTGAITENASGFTVNGGASLLVPPSWTRFLWSDGVNYVASRLPDFGAFPNCTGGGNALQFTSATGIFTCGSSASGVSSFSGDGALITNVTSTGAVTATLGTAPAHKVWMNNTASPAAPGYFSIGEADLPATTVFTDKANTMGAFLQDFSAGTINLPTSGGCTAGATSKICYDSTNKNMHLYANNADAINAVFASAPTNNVLPKAVVSAGNVLEANSSITDDGTTVTSTDTGGIKAPVFTATGSTAGFVDYPQGSTSSGVAPCNTANSICEQAPTSVTAYVLNKPGAAPTNNNSASICSNANPSVCAFSKMAQVAFLTTSYTNATTTFSNVTGLSFSAEANTNYHVQCNLDYQTSATTADIKIQWTGPASPTAVTYDMVTEVTASSFSASVATAFSTALSEAGTPTITTNFPLSLTMTLINGANAGTVQLQAAATATGTITIIPGSCQIQ